MEKKLTALQQAIEWVSNKQEGEHTAYSPEMMELLDTLRLKLESLLPEEKKQMEDAYSAAQQENDWSDPAVGDISLVYKGFYDYFTQTYKQE